MFWDIPEYGQKSWVVAAKIEPQEETEGLTDDQVIQGCINFLNTPPPRRKYQKKKSKPIYGNLAVYKASYNREQNVITALLITGDRKNKHFWGTGAIGK